MVESYTHGHHESVLRSHSWRTIQNSAAYLAPYLERGQSILDVGSGPGTITREFADRVSPGRVVGLDSSAEVTEKTRASSAGVDDLEFVVGDAYELPFADGSFDVVHAHQVLQHLARPIDALVEMRRVLRPGGILAVRDVDYAGTVWAPANPGLDSWLDLYERVARSNGGEPDAGRLLKGWVREAGFTDTEASASIWCFASESEREWWGGLWADRALLSTFATDSEERGFATRAELEAISQAWRGWAANADATLFMPHGEIIARR